MWSPAYWISGKLKSAISIELVLKAYPCQTEEVRMATAGRVFPYFYAMDHWEPMSAEASAVMVKKGRFGGERGWMSWKKNFNKAK